jgi:phage antirepressor YoqD-like protein
MSSRDISSLVEVPHDSILKTIRGLADKGVVSPNETRYQNEQNKQFYPEFHLTKRDALVIASGYSVGLRARIIDRWQELESSNHQAIPKSFAEALRLAADQQETIQAQAAQIEHQKPAVEFVERYVESTGNLGFRQVCKLLKAKEPAFRLFLQNRRIMYKLGDEWTVYQPHIDAGRFIVIAWERNNRSKISAKFTPKGVEWVAKLWGEK